MTNDQSIGVFDSGIGGLTVLKGIRETLPNENILYLGDTARVPYGTKSAQSVKTYAEQAAHTLIKRNIKYLIIACNTATAYALNHLQQLYPNLPIIGVIEPSAKSAYQQTRNNHIAVLATQGTIESNAYQTEIQKNHPKAKVTSVACPLFVTLAEEGWTQGPLVEQIIQETLKSVLIRPDKPDCYILGCTHYPLLTSPIQNVTGKNTTLINSANSTAQTVKQHLHTLNINTSASKQGQIHFLVTDSVKKFQENAEKLIPQSTRYALIEHIDLTV